jgi:organic solute transporter subunit alpha
MTISHFTQIMADGLFVTAINVLGITLFTVGGASVLFILLLYADTLWHIMKNASPLVKTHSAFVLSVYPVSYIICITSHIKPL